jgi:hypothetical protein
MSAGDQESCGHSADVRMELRLNGLTLPIAQLGPTFLILEQRVDHAPADAEIAVWIDGWERHWKVHLAEGIKTGQLRTSISRCALSSAPAPGNG